jgi:hypothetical protein
MSIEMITLWRPHHNKTPDDIRSLVKDSAASFKNAGATNVSFCVFKTGTNAGMTAIVVRYPDYEAFGKAQAQLKQDSGYTTALTEAHQRATIADRFILETEDL